MTWFSQHSPPALLGQISSKHMSFLKSSCHRQSDSEVNKTMPLTQRTVLYIFVLSCYLPTRKSEFWETHFWLKWTGFFQRQPCGIPNAFLLGVLLCPTAWLISLGEISLLGIHALLVSFLASLFFPDPSYEALAPNIPEFTDRKSHTIIWKSKFWAQGYYLLIHSSTALTFLPVVWIPILLFSCVDLRI